MAGKTPRLYLEHVRDAIGLIEQYLRNRQREDFDREPMLRQAIERNIEIVSEATRRIPEAMKARHPEVPWRDIAAIGNILRHEYPAVDHDIIWRVATESIRPLAAAVAVLLSEIRHDAKEQPRPAHRGCRSRGQARQSSQAQPAGS